MLPPHCCATDSAVAGCVLRTAAAMRQMGAEISKDEATGIWRARGRGIVEQQAASLPEPLRTTLLRDPVRARLFQARSLRTVRQPPQMSDRSASWPRPAFYGTAG
jgi:hypothetical protein